MILANVMKDKVLKKIGEMVERSTVNQVDKADKYKKWLKELDFRQLDMGTNRQIFVHDDYPKVVFKVALDEQGILDNLNEYEKSDKSKYFPMSHDIDKDGYILVQQRVPVVDRSEFLEKDIRKQVRGILKELDKEGFVLIDLGSDKHKNFGVDKNGDIYIIDFGYVEHKNIANFNCPHIRYKDGGGQKYCKGTLEYNKDFTMVQCTECENIFQVDIVLEGYTKMRYDNPTEKDRPFEVSDELKSFYKRFTKTRDRSTLTEYVEISNKSAGGNKPIEESEETLVGKSPKEILMAKLGKVAPDSKHPSVKFNKSAQSQTLSQQLKKSEEVEDDLDLDFEEEETEVREVYTVDPSPELHDPKLEKVIQDDMAEGNYQMAARKLRALGSPEDEAAEIVEALFFEKYPELRAVVDEHRRKVANGTDSEMSDDLGSKSDDIIELDEESVEYARILKENGLHIVDRSTSNEIHIGMFIEELKASPILVASKNGMVFYIDIKEHVDRLYESSDVQDNAELSSDWIVTHMSTLPVSAFNKNDYDEWYNENEED